jgi:tetratricopeptide (TPR) repeat protein
MSSAQNPGDGEIPKGVDSAGKEETATSEKSASEASATKAGSTKEINHVKAAERQKGRLRFDRIMAGLVLVFAFLLGATVIHNSDVFLHLATGRYLAADFSGIGVDLFCCTTEGVLWVNHSWLFDLLSYGLYSLYDGGLFLVLLRAAVVVGLAATLLQIRQREDNIWLPVVTTAVALTAMSPWLLYQPVIVSHLFFALTLFILVQRGTVRIAGRTLSRLWLLIPLFLLWVNLDGWFILGPVTVALFLLGEGIQTLLGAPRKAGGDEREPVNLKLLGVVFVGGLAACLVNPFGYHAFQLPTEFAYVLRGMGDYWPEMLVAAGSTVHESQQYDPTFLGLLDHWQSPLQQAVAGGSGGASTVADFGYFLLLVGCFLSFVGQIVFFKGSTSEFPWSRLLLWLFFGLLAYTLGAFVPFFAIISAVVLTWNVGTSFAILKPPVTSKQLQSREQVLILGRVVTFLGLLLLLAFAWPGWLQKPAGSGTMPYRVGMHVEVDPGLQAVAQRLEELAQEEKIGNGFNLSPDIACYCAWFAPGVKSFYDYRFGLFAGKGKMIAEIRQGLREPLVVVVAQGTVVEGPDRKKQNDIFRSHAITHAVIPAFEGPDHSDEIVHSLLFYDARWTLIAESGSACALRWWPERTGLKQEAKKIRIDPNALAFSPDLHQAESRVAPFPEKDLFWVHYAQGHPVRNQERLSASFYLLWNRALMSRAYQDHDVRKKARMTQFAKDRCSLIGICASALPSFEFGTPLSVSIAHTLFNSIAYPPTSTNYPYGQLSVVALQKARKGVIDFPNEFEARWTLATAGSTLSKFERDLRGNAELVTMKDTFRKTQWLAALNQALEINPDAYEVHLALYNHYLEEQTFPDLALDHLEKAFVAFGRAKRGVTGVLEEDYQKRFQEIEEHKIPEKLKKEVQERKQYLASRLGPATKMPLGAKLQLALVGDEPFLRQNPAMGMVLEAFQILEDAKDSLKKEDSLVYVLNRASLLAQTGRIKELKAFREEWEEVQAESKEKLPLEVQQNLWHFTLLLAVATGDYPLMEKTAGKIEKAIRDDRGFQQILQKDLPLAVVPFEINPFTWTSAAMYPLRYGVDKMGSRRPSLSALTEMNRSLVPLAELHFVTGLLALELGDMASAEEHFRKALELSPPGTHFPDWPIAATYLNQLRNQKSR